MIINIDNRSHALIIQLPLLLSWVDYSHEVTIMTENSRFLGDVAIFNARLDIHLMQCSKLEYSINKVLMHPCLYYETGFRV